MILNSCGLRPSTVPYAPVRVSEPFILGTIVVQNALQNSLFAGQKQPLMVSNVAAIVIRVTFHCSPLQRSR